MLVRIATTNDTSGNPRRGWLKLTAGGEVIGWIEEGYLGRGAIEGYCEGESPTIYIKPSEYKRFKHWGETIQENFSDRELKIVDAIKRKSFRLKTGAVSEI